MREPFDGARSTLNVLFNIQIILGIAIITFTTFYLFRINAFLGAKEHKILLGQLLHFFILGLIIILINVANLQLWRRLWQLPTTNLHTIMFLNLWLCFNTLILLCGLCTLWCLGQCAMEIVTMAETALTVGIDKYFEFPDWKLRWDELQINQQCCGVISYNDWQTAAWLPSKAIYRSSLKTRAPYSCCRKDDPNCYKIHAPDARGSMPILPLDAINRNGCILIFRQHLYHLINLLWGIILIALCFQLCIWFLVKFIIRNQGTQQGQDFSSVNQAANDFENPKYTEKLCNCEYCRAAHQDSRI